jgi:hypothetical protein
MSSNKGRSTIVGDTWKPKCGMNIIPDDLRHVFPHVHADRCIRRRRHVGRCRGARYKWDPAMLRSHTFEVRKILST